MYVHIAELREVKLVLWNIVQVHNESKYFLAAALSAKETSTNTRGGLINLGSCMASRTFSRFYLIF